MTVGERQWLLAVSRGPMHRTAVDLSIPKGIIELLIAKRLVRWESDALEITASGEGAVAELRSRRS
jgi:hypothetical protein